MPATAPSPSPKSSARSSGGCRLYFGANSGKYPDGKQVLVEAADTRAALDTPIVSNCAAFEASELVVLGHSPQPSARLRSSCGGEVRAAMG